MFCENCGNQLDEGAVFCSKCGAKFEMGENEETQNTIFSELKEHNSHWTKVNNVGKRGAFIIAGVVIVFFLIIHMLGRLDGNVDKIENQIATLTVDIADNAEKIVILYEDYEKLSNSKKEKIANRETLLNAYTEATQIIENRRANAAIVDELISQIDTQNIYAEASTVKEAVIQYNKLDEYERGYLEYEDTLSKYYDEVKDLNVDVTRDNILQLYNIQFSIGEKTNAGEIASSLEGYNWDYDEQYITPDYNIEFHSDHYTPVYVYVSPRYPNLLNNCNFYINLHQTYNGLGIVDSDVHEFEFQARTISYDSEMGIGEYLVPVEINNAQGGFLDLLGYSMDIQDFFHDMNEFDSSRVEISDVSGTVRY